MTPTKAIETLPDLIRTLNSHVSPLVWETEDIAENWARLGQLGGQRDDHAAELLCRLRPSLENIARFCTDCATQITRMKADPFGREQAA